MEHSTSAVNWQPRNIAKRPGEMARNSLAHLARGADAHPVLPVACVTVRRREVPLGDDSARGHVESRVFREVTALGRDLGPARRDARFARCVADVAILWDFESFWAQDLEWRPSVDVTHAERIRAYYERLWRDGITVDFACPATTSRATDS